MDRWDELRTALYVYELGTVTAAADALGVHRATVMRHIDTLEEQFKTSMFRRESHGYIPTESCAEALIAVKQAEKLLAIASGKVRGSIPTRAKPVVMVSVIPPALSLITPGITTFLREHPNARVKLENTERVALLDSGEIDVAVRGGKKPQESGLIVEHLVRFSIGFYATRSYLEHKGRPETLADFNEHIFIGPEAGKAMPFASWVRRNLPSDCMRVFVGNGDVALQTTLSGLGICTLPDFVGHRHPELELLDHLPDILNDDLWLVSHDNSPHAELVANLIGCIKHKI